MAKIDELPPDLWPTWRWLHNWIQRRGIKTEDFIREAAIPEAAFKNALDAPDYPLPFTTQWRRAVSDRVKIGARCAVLDAPSADETSISELVARLHRHGISIQRTLHEAQVKRSTYNGWAFRKKIPDTSLGKRFIVAANLLLNSVEPGSSRLIRLEYGVKVPPLDVSPAEIIENTRKKRIPLSALADVAGVSFSCFYTWKNRGTIPDSRSGRAFVAAYTEALESEPSKNNRSARLPVPARLRGETIIDRLRAARINISRIAREAGLPPALIHSWKAARYIPDTDSGRAFVAAATKAIEFGPPKSDRRPEPYIVGADPGQIWQNLQARGVRLKPILNEIGLSKAAFYAWRKRGRIPNTDAGRAFVSEAKKYLSETE